MNCNGAVFHFRNVVVRNNSVISIGANRIGWVSPDGDITGLSLRANT